MQSGSAQPEQAFQGHQEAASSYMEHAPPTLNPGPHQEATMYMDVNLADAANGICLKAFQESGVRESHH